MLEFRWNDWNLEHATSHGVALEECEAVVRDAKPPFPRDHGENKWGVWGRGQGGRLVQVIYVIDADGTLYVIHARPLNENEKRRYRRRTR